MNPLMPGGVLAELAWMSAQELNFTDRLFGTTVIAVIAVLA